MGILCCSCAMCRDCTSEAGQKMGSYEASSMARGRTLPPPSTDPTNPGQTKQGHTNTFCQTNHLHHQDRPQLFNPSTLDFVLTLMSIFAKLTQAFLCRTAERVLECKWKVMIRVVHLSGGNLLPTAQAGQGQATVHAQLFRRH